MMEVDLKGEQAVEGWGTCLEGFGKVVEFEEKLEVADLIWYAEGAD